jgi:hypothetical protein
MLTGFVILKGLVPVDWSRTRDEDGPAFIAGMRALYERHPKRVGPSTSRIQTSEARARHRLLR